MFSKHFLAGVSTLAFAAGAASAQTNVNTIDSSGTGNTTACNNSAPATTGNTCSITQAGNNNNGTSTQSTNNNRSVIRQTGNTNTVAHNQLGSTGNNAETNQSGSQNNTQLVQNGALNDSLTNQSGVGHTAGIRQRGGVAATAGSGNFARITQSDGPEATDSGSVVLRQNGNANSATLIGGGNVANFSVRQGGDVNGDGSALGTQTGDSNTVNANLQGVFTQTVIRQVATGADASNQVVTNNVANVGISNGATAANTFFFGFAQITQTSSGNSATAIVNDGGRFSANSQNSAVISQSNSTVNSNALSRNSAFVSISQGSQMTGNVTQNGRDNFADVTITSGVAGNDPGVPGRDGGNASTINQTGTVDGAGGSTAYVSVQAPRNVAAQGFGNDSTINQTTGIAFLAPTGTSQPAGTTGTGEPANINGSRGLYATLWQQGRYSTANITQGDGPGQTLANSTYGTGPSTVYGRARAGVYQAGILNNTTVNQNGDNYADVTQGLLGAGTGSTVNVNQVDAGDGSTAGPPDGFGNPTVIAVRAYNRALVTQYGNTNTLTGTQNTVGGFQSLFQRQASANNSMTSEQGTGGTAAFNSPGAVVARQNSSTFISAAPLNGAATSGLSATIEQSGTQNLGRVFQDGVNLTANVTQLGSGGAGGGAERNSVLVAQQGTNNRATALQTANVGRSPADSTPTGTSPAAGPGRFAGAAGPNSAEIVILQSGGNATTGGNRAYAEQQGKGQYARIEQTGLRNVAGIQQQTNATNAVAAITQSGDDNSYYIVQTTAGQYIDVTQIGTNNTTVTQSGGAGGSAGFTPPPGFPSF